MADKQKKKQMRLQRRKWSVRNSLFGTPERPRLAVFRSDKHIYAQLIDDYRRQDARVGGVSTSGEVRGDLKNGGNIAAAKLVGKAIAERAKAAGITKVAFDRGGRHVPRPRQGAGRRRPRRRPAVLNASVVSRRGPHADHGDDYGPLTTDEPHG